LTRTFFYLNRAVIGHAEQRDRKGLRQVHPIQAYLDLKGHPERASQELSSKANELSFSANELVLAPELSGWAGRGTCGGERECPPFGINLSC
jgi:hypothetical protein